MKKPILLLLCLSLAAAPAQADTSIAETGTKLVTEIELLIAKKDAPSLRAALTIGDAYQVLQKEYPQDLKPIDSVMQQLSGDLADLDKKQKARPSITQPVSLPGQGSGGGTVSTEAVLQSFSSLLGLAPQERQAYVDKLAPDLKLAVEQYQKDFPQLLQPVQDNSTRVLFDALSQAASNPKTLQSAMEQLPAQQKQVVKTVADQIQ
jgi:hypothetical protein